ncbi:DUF2934 domain-containing protein [Phyllobacterium salinisoli]|uniref:DUF2934 domain-containing protein n=1 Tax=Phyllobacterium salinisoli TaxID=1899321 RepID=A0A368K9Z6_9HYPH|nr:DUF2934 domain-containing protein [Phyllobacterium salinisoli]RCS25323.1 DUF2934 domain-containing protein [Phyllobacterium salinisoli]
MESGREEQIKARAYEIWEQEGRPTGREHLHWEQARRELNDLTEEEALPPPDGPGENVEISAADANDNFSAAVPELASDIGGAGAGGAETMMPVKRPRKPGTRRK